MAVLVIVFAVLVVSYASSMRAYLQQRAQMNDLKDQISTSQRQINALKLEKLRWNDKAYVEQQARERFGWVLPGETAYQVIGRDGKPLVGTDQLSSAASLDHSTPTAWWTRAYGTLEEADHPHVNDKPAPLTKIVPTAPAASTKAR